MDLVEKGEKELKYQQVPHRFRNLKDIKRVIKKNLVDFDLTKIFSLEFLRTFGPISSNSRLKLLKKTMEDYQLSAWKLGCVKLHVSHPLYKKMQEEKRKKKAILDSKKITSFFKPKTKSTGHLNTNIQSDNDDNDDEFPQTQPISRVRVKLTQNVDISAPVGTTNTMMVRTSVSSCINKKKKKWDKKELDEDEDDEEEFEDIE